MTANRAFTRRIRLALNLADDSAHALGVLWYPQAQAIAQQCAETAGVSLAHAAVVMAHLSPQCPWQLNVKATRRLLAGDGERENGILHACYARAIDSLDATDPVGTFGRRANKTRNFALNIIGDEQAVTVDTWVARVCGITSERAVFDSPRLYREIADSYRTVAKRSDYSPREIQAITWIQARGTAA